VSFAKAVRLLVKHKTRDREEKSMNEKLIRYSIQIAMLKQLLSRNLISEKEYLLIKRRIMKDYKIVSDITS
jgi:hypothetical protein